MTPFKKTFSRFDKHDDEQRKFKATCVKCHSTCEVPFKPNGRKPVLCHDCFKQSGDRPRSPRFDRDRDDRRGSYDRPSVREYPREDHSADIIRQLKSLNEKMDRLIDLIGNAGGEQNEE